MPRRKGTPNTPQTIIDEIVRKHHEEATLKSLAAEYKNHQKYVHKRK